MKLGDASRASILWTLTGSKAIWLFGCLNKLRIMSIRGSPLFATPLHSHLVLTRLPDDPIEDNQVITKQWVLILKNSCNSWCERDWKKILPFPQSTKTSCFDCVWPVLGALLLQALHLSQ